jgi:hypothetical protein
MALVAVTDIRHNGQKFKAGDSITKSSGIDNEALKALVAAGAVVDRKALEDEAEPEPEPDEK